MRHVAVIVPAHNEEDTIGGCLDALQASTVDADIVVVLDACTDRTARRARRRGVRTVTVDARNVGVARAAGMSTAPDADWLATTDADSLVPPDWLAHHLGHAEAGADVVAGTVDVDTWHGWPPPLKVLYGHRYATGAGHVHGANLSFSPAAYRVTGGFPPVPLDEDTGFVAAARRAHLRIVHTTGSPVVTSSRRHARALGGFSSHLVRLAGTL